MGGIVLWPQQKFILVIHTPPSPTKRRFYIRLWTWNSKIFSFYQNTENQNSRVFNFSFYKKWSYTKSGYTKRRARSRRIFLDPRGLPRPSKRMSFWWNTRICFSKDLDVYPSYIAPNPKIPEPAYSPSQRASFSFLTHFQKQTKKTLKLQNKH